MWPVSCSRLTRIAQARTETLNRLTRRHIGYKNALDCDKSEKVRKDYWRCDRVVIVYIIACRESTGSANAVKNDSSTLRQWGWPPSKVYSRAITRRMRLIYGIVDERCKQQQICGHETRLVEVLSIPLPKASSLHTWRVSTNNFTSTLHDLEVEFNSAAKLSSQ
jgi:hypothetical protein